MRPQLPRSPGFVRSGDFPSLHTQCCHWHCSDARCRPRPPSHIGVLGCPYILSANRFVPATDGYQRSRLVLLVCWILGTALVPHLRR